VLELFICKAEIKIVLRGGCSLSTTGNGVLAIFHTRQVESSSEFFEKFGTSCFFIKLGTPPHFSFLLRLRWSDQLPWKISDEQMKHASQGVLNSIWKIAIPTIYVLMS
jgi:hypothetical protein